MFCCCFLLLNELNSFEIIFISLVINCYNSGSMYVNILCYGCVYFCVLKFIKQVFGVLIEIHVTVIPRM